MWLRRRWDWDYVGGCSRNLIWLLPMSLRSACNACWLLRWDLMCDVLQVFWHDIHLFYAWNFFFLAKKMHKFVGLFVSLSPSTFMKRDTILCLHSISHITQLPLAFSRKAAKWMWREEKYPPPFNSKLINYCRLKRFYVACCNLCTKVVACHMVFSNGVFYW